MTFTSLAFFAFFAAFYPLYLSVRTHAGARLALILIGSTVFYGWWDWRFLFLIAFTGSVDFLAGLALERFRGHTIVRRVCLVVSILSGIGILGVFKYSGFSLILPVGISFYTFQSLSYTIDVYRGNLKPTRNPVHFFAYLMFFPQLVAGPIVRASDLLWRLKRDPELSAEATWRGLGLCVFGFFKKCVIADNIAHYVDLAFANVLAESHSSFWWMTMVSFAIQIYCDFSGYSDIARGLMEILGYRIGINFDHPCLSTGVKDFWRRWHISLSGWFRDYVYVPLGGGRGGPAKTVRNLWIVFLLSGIWHGAGWGFVAWGAVHALWLSVERLVPYQAGLRRLRGPGVLLCWFIAQLQIVSAWAFFRADTLPEALHIVGRMFAFHDFSHGLKQCWLYIALFAAIELWSILGMGERCRRRLPGFVFFEAVGLALVAAATVWFRGEGHAFIYFQF